MNFSASEIEQITWQMRLADWPRSQNRGRINDLFNGLPPFSQDYMQQNHAATNVNTLEAPEMAHDARLQYNTALLSPDPAFNVAIDYGAKHKRFEYGQKVTSFINKPIRESVEHYELGRSVIASNVLHGIGPSMWEDRDGWCGVPIGIEDVFIPSNVLLGFKNLPFFAVYRQYTGMQLQKLTQGPKVDKAWQMPLVKQAIEWLDTQASKLMSASWPEVWSPEKMSERIKSDAGLYASDAVPIIGAYDFYYWNDDNKVAGWNRRIILDAWGSPGPGWGGGSSPTRNFDHGKGEFLYDPGDRKYGDKLSEIIHFQFADCSSVAPFRYHSVRSLGFLLFAICHLQNRLRCKFNDAVFEAMLQYFRCGNPDDHERLSKVDLIDKGIIPEGLEFIKAQDRWTVQAGLAESAMTLNWQTMARNSSSFAQTLDMGEQGQTNQSRETATLTMQRAQSGATLITSMMTQAYVYESFRHREICRRFCIKNSRDPDVRKFRVRCLKEGIPEEALNVECWDISTNKVMGGGNKMLQVAMADKLMAMRQVLDPQAQKVVDRIYVVANSDNYDLAQELVPDTKAISHATLDAQRAAGSLLAGLPVGIEEGINHIDYVEALLADMGIVVQKAMATGGMASPETLFGLQNMAQHIEAHIQIIAQNEQEKARVKQYMDALGQLMNEVKAMGQRLQEQMQKQAQSNGQQMDPEVQAKIQATMITAQAKAQNTRESHAERTAQRRLSFEQQMQQDEQKHKLDLEKEFQEFRVKMMAEMEQLKVDASKARIKVAEAAVKLEAKKREPKAKAVK